MTRAELESIWQSKPLQFWGHVACWDEEGLARPGRALVTECNADVWAFRNLIRKMNQARRLRREAGG